MMVGIQNITNVTAQQIANITNVSNYAELAVNVNNDIYGGWLFFIMLLVLWFIAYAAFGKSERLQSKYAVKIMYSGMFVSLISFALRLVEVAKQGVVRGLLTDFQMWIFPIITILIATFLYATKE